MALPEFIPTVLLPIIQLFYITAHTRWLFLNLFLHVRWSSVTFRFKLHQEDCELKSPIMSVETSLPLLLRLQILLEIHVSFFI